MKKMLIVIGILVLAGLAYKGFRMEDTQRSVATGQRWMNDKTGTVYVVVDIGRGDSLKAKWRSRIELSQEMLTKRVVVSVREGQTSPLHAQLPVWFAQKHTRLAD